MTTERNLRLDLTDISVVRLECKKCRASLSYVVEEWKQVPPNECKNCGTTWVTTGSAADRALRTLIENLRQLRADADGLGLRIQFELPNPEGTN